MSKKVIYRVGNSSFVAVNRPTEESTHTVEGVISGIEVRKGGAIWVNLKDEAREASKVVVFEYPEAFPALCAIFNFVAQGYKSVGFFLDLWRGPLVYSYGDKGKIYYDYPKLDLPEAANFVAEGINTRLRTL